MQSLTLTTAVLLVVFVTLINAQRDRAGCCDDYCYDTDNERPQSTHFASKTAYELIRGRQSVRQYYVPNCTPVKFWLLSRHGTRLPSTGSIKDLRKLVNLRDEVIRNYEERKTKPDVGPLCDEDIELLRHWTWNANITDDKGGMLTTQGWDDLKYLAIHYQSAFPDLLENIYSPQKFMFRYTTSERTNDSLKGFLEGLFGDQAYNHVRAQTPLKEDMVLTPYKMCKAYDTNSEKNDAEDSESNKFEEGPVYQKLIQDVSRRLGFKFDLKASEVRNIFDMCRYDQAWTLDRPSAWCSAFTQAQVNILEYYHDLNYFHENGYAVPELTSNIACGTVTDMLRFLESKDLPKVSASFSHSSIIQLFITALGAAKDTVPLRADNYAQMSRRKWRSSEITPFAANVAAIKYDCPNDNERTKVMFFLNQKPMDFPYCNVGLCNWSDVKRMHGRFESADCSRTFCGSGAGGKKTTLTTLLFAILTLIGQYL